ncbi:MAG TPA: hypothetical protein VFG69_17010, partial [Nannocystaceae bacterium]|nr:hypothetical protein [Nannocystaceae bacterium]
AAGLVAREPSRLFVEDVHSTDGADRARLRIAGTDETVHVEVLAPRAPTPPPPPLPPPPPRDELRIRIEGGMFGHFPCCGHGWLEIDLFGLEHLEHLDAFVWGDDAFGWDAYGEAMELQAEALEEALEARQDALEDALEAAEDARVDAVERALERAEGARRPAFDRGWGRGHPHAAPPAAADSGTVSL